MNNPCTIYLADDHQIVIDGLKLLIGGEPLMKVVGAATNGDTAGEEILIKRPDIALVDLMMPGLDGLQLISMLRKVAVGTKFVVLSMDDSQRSMRDAMSYGASGYLLKNAGKMELTKCLSLVMQGEQYFPNLRTGKNLNNSLFTPKESEIIRMVLKNLTTAEIADELTLSPHTVTVHRKNIARKTNTKTPLGLKKFLEENSIEL
jgi:two-component system nitrate/nitrite response regulator NarL